MKRFVEGLDRGQSTLFPASLDDYVTEENPVRAVDVFVDSLDLEKLGFGGVQPLDTGRPSYHPSTMLKLYVYGYLNRIPSSRRLERECQRNIEMIWLTGQLAPARWNPIKIAVDVELEHSAGVIAGSAGVKWLDTAEAELLEVETVDEHIDRSHRVFLGHIIIERCREQCALPAIQPFNKALHRMPR